MKVACAGPDEERAARTPDDDRAEAAPAEPLPGAGPAVRLGLGSILDQLVVSGTSFVMNLIVARCCVPQEYGAYALALTLVLFARGIQSGLVCSPYTVYAGRRRGQALTAYTGSALAHYLLLSVLSSLVALAAAVGLTMSAERAAAAGLAWMVVAALPFLLLRECLRLVAFAHLQVRIALRLDATVALLQLGGLLVLAHFQMLSAAAAFAVAGAACATACAGWFLARRIDFRIVAADLRGDWRSNWAFGRWSVASFLIGNVPAFLLAWVLALAHGAAAMAVLAACTTLVNAAGTYVTGVSNLLTPRAARAWTTGGLADLRRVLGRAALLYGLTLGLFCVLVLVLGEWAAALIYKGKFTGCGPILVLLAVTLLLDSFGITAGIGLWALNRPQANVAADVCTLVAVVLTIGLVISLGAVGAAVAALAGKLAGVIVRCITLLRLMGDRAGGLQAV
jgi:O-antigen/teichoic acid export membrane protein